jgi:type VI secretion system protein ImpF
MSELIRGLAVPLFDRLSQDDAVSGARYLETEQAIRDSIARELHRLFNTRSSLHLQNFADGNGSVLEYGIPDFSSVSIQNNTEMDVLRRALTLAVERFEPRLGKVSVKFDGRSASTFNSVSVNIASEARIGTELRRMDFEIALDSSADRSVKIT